MLAQPVAVVRDVALGPHVLAAQVLVAAVAGARLGELVLVLVAREADGHRRAHVVRVGRHALVAVGAVALHAHVVLRVAEPQVLEVLLHPLARGLQAVAAAAVASVVGLACGTLTQLGRVGQVVRVGVGRA